MGRRQTIMPASGQGGVTGGAVRSPAMSDHRLPRHVLPRHYTLELKPDMDDYTFAGTVAIDVDVVEPTDWMVMNAADLVVLEASILVAGERSPVSVSMDGSAERLVLTTVDRIRPGRVRLELAFTGVLNDRLRGFYRSTLVGADGVERTIATTQFQSTDARRAFPCFDEPDMKASFGITLVVPEELLAVSNGAEVSRTSLEDGTDRVVFADTIALSTYLVAFVVGPLEATDPIHVDGVPVRIIHPPGRADQTAFALEVAAHSLRWLADWYDIAVPGGKVDLVALPDFAFGAMENLGCITFREVLLLVDPTSADQHELESVAAVISHELAHLWFGDLVTMRWWNGIWLNEAFATFMEMKAVEAWRPDWDVWAGFGAARAAALDIDALASTRPIEYPVVTPADAESMFDLLTYQKGAAVVRMLEQFLGEEVFRDGVHRYLSAHLGGNTDNEDLWTALEEASGQPVGDLMHAWIFRGGFPVVEGTVEGGRCTLVQRRFRYDGVDDDARWEVPVRLRTTVGEQRILLGDSPLVLDLEGPLVTLNVGAEGFYRSEVDVPPDPGRLTPVERAMSVDDRWAATLGGRHNPASFAGFVAAFADDPDLAVWQAVLRGLYTMNLVAPGRHLTMAAEAAGLLGGMVHRLGWEPSDGEDDRTRQLRGVLLVAAGTLADDPGVIGEARRRWSAGTSTDPAVDGAVVTIVASHGDSADRADCRRRFDAAGTSQEEQRHLRALALFPGLTEVEALLDEVHGGAIRTQDAPFLIRSLLAHPHHRALIWRNLVDHWEDLTGRLPSNGIARMLEGIRALGADADPDVDRFLDEHPTPQGALMVAQHRERRHVNLGLGNRLAG
jgi:puromycin-sensitive aminopeptidase